MLTHIPVLFRDVLRLLQLTTNDNVIDATVGGGGHARGLLEAIAPNGRLLGIDGDDRTLAQTVTELQTFGSRFIPVHGNFRHLQAHAVAHHFGSVHAVLFDLGLSSIALEDAARGFSFQQPGPLDMRFDRTAQTLTAAAIVNSWAGPQLMKIFREYGQEPLAEKIAGHLVIVRRKQRLMTTTGLANAVEAVKPRRGRRHPATQVFQALRIAVNDEFGALREALPQALTLLELNHCLAVITFHSLEDRIVKEWSKAEAKAGRLILVNKHVIVPSREEQKNNPRSRSAKLRVMKKIANPK